LQLMIQGEVRKALQLGPGPLERQLCF
jgi:hypothetical protein